MWLEIYQESAIRKYKFVQTSGEVFDFIVISFLSASKVVFYRGVGFVRYSQICMFKQLGDKCGFFPYIGEGSSFLLRFIIVTIFFGYFLCVILSYEELGTNCYIG